MRAVAYRFGDAQGNTREINDKKCPQPDADGNRQLGDNQLRDRFVLEVAFPQIERQVVAHHLHESLMRGFVEAIQRLEFLEARRVESGGTAIK